MPQRRLAQHYPSWGFALLPSLHPNWPELVGPKLKGPPRAPGQLRVEPAWSAAQGASLRAEIPSAAQSAILHAEILGAAQGLILRPDQVA